MIDRTLPGNIEALPLDFFCVSCDLVAGDLVVHRRGALAKAIGASVSIPALVPPMARHGRLLVDGGVLNNLPVDVMAASHEGPIVAVDVTARVTAPVEDAALSLHETLVRAHEARERPDVPRAVLMRLGEPVPRVLLPEADERGRELRVEEQQAQ